MVTYSAFIMECIVHVYTLSAGTRQTCAILVC